MKYSCYRFSLDIQSTQSQISLPVHLNDTSRRLYIDLVDGGNPFPLPDGCVAVLSAKKADKNKLYHYCVIENQTRIRYDFTQQTASCVGKVECEIQLYGEDGKLITSPRFVIMVDTRVVKGSEFVVSDSEINAIDAISLSEAERVKAESERTAAEKSRTEAEKSRAETELTRTETETARVEAEQIRAATEKVRIEAEKSRVEAENSRVAAEKARVQTEAERVKAEEEREKTFEELIENGITAYELAVKHGFVGSEAEWIDSLHGTDGKNGSDGKDGYTPIKGVDYFDGKNGTNGKDGADGYTPVKGTDYFTESDKTEMVSAVIEALPVYNGEVVSV